MAICIVTALNRMWQQKNMIIFIEMGNLSELLLHLTTNGASEPLSGKKEKKV